jgi:hypothetical protein
MASSAREDAIKFDYQKGGSVEAGTKSLIIR